MKKYIVSSVFAILLVAVLQGCFRTNMGIPEELKPTLPSVPFDYKDQSFWSSNFRTIFDNSFMKERFDYMNNDVITLGRVLFYDTKLSVNNTVSCGTCHKQRAAFSDVTALSRGFEDKMTHRNTPPVINAMMMNDLFWDSRSHSVQDLVLKPVQHEVEMGMESMGILTQKLSRTEYYPELFRKAFGSVYISEANIQEALTQFVQSMISAGSKYDKGLDNDFVDFNPMEKMGYEVFRSTKAKCATCHSEPNFTVSSFIQTNPTLDINGNFFLSPFMGGDIVLMEVMPGGSFGGSYGVTSNTTNIGLDVIYADQGRMNGQFKIPSIRNIELTAPYMHDGRFNTLEEVVEHYSKNIRPHAHLDAKFMDNVGGVKPIGLSEIEKQALVAFLKTLTDNSFVTDKKFSNPFKP